MTTNFSDEEREGWAQMSLESLSRAYSDEPEYSLDLIKEANPEYEGKLPSTDKSIIRLGSEPIEDE